jgi:predicted dehydrogenase
MLAAGKSVFMEKPFAASGDACTELLAAAEQHSAVLGVNQNFVHHPAFVRLQRLITGRTLGRPNFVGCIYNVPLRQMAARQFGHWMFTERGLSATFNCDDAKRDLGWPPVAGPARFHGRAIRVHAT